jgi:hypothetical protein
LAQRSIYSGSTGVLLNVYLVSSSTGTGLTGLAYNTAGLTAYYFQNNGGASVQIPLVSMPTLGTWVSGGLAEIDPTNMPGLYSLGLPNAALSSGQALTIVIQGASGLHQYSLDLEITATNNQDANRGGLLSLPTAPMAVAQNVALNNFQFVMRSSTDHVTPVAGLTVVTMVSINGAAFVPTTNSATSLSNGVYNLNLAAADLNGSVVTLLCTATGADALPITFLTQA